VAKDPRHSQATKSERKPGSTFWVFLGGGGPQLIIGFRNLQTIVAPVGMPPTLHLDEGFCLAVFPELDLRYFDAGQGTWQDAHPYGTCTFVNVLPVAFLESQGHRCEMFGKPENAFAGQQWQTVYDCVTGHDWLLVDGRWLVDFWISAYLGIDRALFDLESPADAMEVDRIYGAKSEWELAEAKITRERCLHPELFKELLLAVA
jgi:hypothetical protein